MRSAPRGRSAVKGPRPSLRELLDLTRHAVARARLVAGCGVGAGSRDNVPRFTGFRSRRTRRSPARPGCGFTAGQLERKAVLRRLVLGEAPQRRHDQQRSRQGERRRRARTAQPELPPRLRHRPDARRGDPRLGHVQHYDQSSPHEVEVALTTEGQALLPAAYVDTWDDGRGMHLTIRRDAVDAAGSVSVLDTRSGARCVRHANVFTVEENRDILYGPLRGSRGVRHILPTHRPPPRTCLPRRLHALRLPLPGGHRTRPDFRDDPTATGGLTAAGRFRSRRMRGPVGLQRRCAQRLC
ncbi:hypothetical protein SsS58_04122 [Streptomyces scabiei]|uniref:Uncharacterized protein n=1 Tax=Streptomyces scabiei TaxID=1930 RepID=A0A100JQF7_STRSC|nr:hypothetical protein SsS58_04122 [Streptomyces scabiei]